MSEYNYGPLEHELAGGQCADDCHFGDRDEPPAPRTGECGEWLARPDYKGQWEIIAKQGDGALRQIVGRLGFYEPEEKNARQIVAEHNRHATLIEQQRFLEDRLAAQTESLAKVVSERNELREQRDQLSATMINTRGILDRFLFASGPRKASRDDLLEVRREIDNVLATIEREGEA